MIRRVRAVAIIVSAAACAGSCAPKYQAGGRAVEPPTRAAQDPGAGSLKAGELPEWWIGEPRAMGGVAMVSASGTAPEVSVARDLAVRNARAAGRAVLGVEPVRVEITREAAVQARPGEFEAFVLARCDGAGAAALPVGGEPPASGRRSGAGEKSTGSAAGTAAAPPARASEPPAEPAPVRAREPEPAPAPARVEEAGPSTPVDRIEAPVWWFDDVRRDGESARACALAEGQKLLDTRRAAVEAVKEKLKGVGVTGPVQTLFIATRKPPEVGYRVYVMGQGDVKK